MSIIGILYFYYVHIMALSIWKISMGGCVALRVFASNENNVQLPVLVPNLIFKAPQK